MDHYNYIIHLDLVRNNKLFYIRRKGMNDKCEYCKEDIEIYAFMDINGSSELCCDECHNQLYEDKKDTENLLRYEIEQIQGE